MSRESAAMKTTTPLLPALLALTFALSTRAVAGGAGCAAMLEAPRVLSENQAEADLAIARLRELGPIGLEMLLLKQKPELDAMRAATPQAFASNTRRPVPNYNRLGEITSVEFTPDR